MTALAHHRAARPLLAPLAAIAALAGGAACDASSDTLTGARAGSMALDRELRLVQRGGSVLGMWLTPAGTGVGRLDLDGLAELLP